MCEGRAVNWEFEGLEGFWDGRGGFVRFLRVFASIPLAVERGRNVARIARGGRWGRADCIGVWACGGMGVRSAEWAIG